MNLLIIRLFSRLKNNIKTGKRKLKLCKVQRYKYKICKKRFTYNKNRYIRMRVNKFIIDKALNLRKERLSYSRIASKINNIVSRQSIWRWIKKYEDC